MWFVVLPALVMLVQYALAMSHFIRITIYVAILSCGGANLAVAIMYGGLPGEHAKCLVSVATSTLMAIQFIHVAWTPLFVVTGLCCAAVGLIARNRPQHQGVYQWFMASLSILSFGFIRASSDDFDKKE